MLTLFSLYNSICAWANLLRSLPYFFLSSSSCGASSAIFRELRCCGSVSGSVTRRIKIVATIIARTKPVAQHAIQEQQHVDEG